MNTMNRTSLQVVVCAAAALVLTIATTWTFVDSTALARVTIAPTQVVASHHAPVHLALAGTTGLLQ